MWTRLGAVLGALAVMLGAFGAHALEGRVDEHLRTVWDTGARYHLVHAVALVALGARPDAPKATGWLWMAGIVLFSGSLYAMTLTGVRMLGAITPFGGLCFIAGWLWLAWKAR
jgi:uncharacterized membrane protein YgdD (TMEM256/DUF423 family)